MTDYNNREIANIRKSPHKPSYAVVFEITRESIGAIATSRSFTTTWTHALTRARNETTLLRERRVRPPGEF